jgi:hypothetical protein
MSFGQLLGSLLKSYGVESELFTKVPDQDALFPI